MSEQEADQIVGRTLRERSEAVKTKVLIEIELDRFRRSIGKILDLDGAQKLTADQRRSEIEWISRFLDGDVLEALINDRSEAKDRILDCTQRLRDMGHGS